LLPNTFLCRSIVAAPRIQDESTLIAAPIDHHDFLLRHRHFGLRFVPTGVGFQGKPAIGKSQYR
jgi:hypothetical protein